MDVNCKNGSTGKLIYDLYNQINKNGDEAYIAYGRGKLIKEKNIFRISTKIEVYIHALLTRITGLTGTFSFFSTRKAIRLIKKIQPDVVHLNDMHGYFINIITLIKFLKQSNIRTIWTFHCEFMYTGKCGHSYECEKWKTECGKCPHLKDYPKSLFFDFTKKMFNDKKKVFENFNNLIITAPSQWLVNRINQSFFKKYPIKVVHNGIDTKIFHYESNNLIHNKYDIPDNMKIVITVAPRLMNEEKGGKYFLEVAKRLRNEKIKFIMIGIENEFFVESENIIQVQMTKDLRLLSNFYSSADLFILCSKKETFSLTCAESLCCGTPIVGFKCGAPETIFTNSYNLFIDYGNVDNLVSAIVEKLNCNINKKEISMENITKFSVENMYVSYYNIFKGKIYD